MIFVYRTSMVGPSGIPLSDYEEGDIIKLNEGGSPVEFYVAKHDYESSLNGAGRTLVVRKDCYDNRRGGRMIYISKLFSPISTGTSAGDIDVGATVKINENGQPVDYLVVHQGLPSDIYDASCEGTWLLRTDIAETRQWHSSNVNDYANSTINAYLNGDWLDRYDADVAEAIKQVKIPYRAGSGYGKTVTSGANGLSAKIFLLSATEVGFNMSYMPTNEGVELAYFSGCADDSADSKRIAYLNSSATNWWLRSPYCVSGLGSTRALCVLYNGNWSSGNCSNSYGIRPALILPYSFKFKEVS